MTGQGDERVAIEAMRAGAHEYLTKPLVLAKLKTVLEKTLSFVPNQYKQARKGID
jgi:FixJ family two-component response regulator